MGEIAKDRSHNVEIPPFRKCSRYQIIDVETQPRLSDWVTDIPGDYLFQFQTIFQHLKITHALLWHKQKKLKKLVSEWQGEYTYEKNGKVQFIFLKKCAKIDFGNMDNGSGVEINDGSKPLTRFEICQFRCQIANFTENRVWPALNCRWWSKSDQNSSEWRLKRHKLHLTVRTQPQMANGIIWVSGMISIFSNFSSYCIEKFGNPFVCIFSPEPSSRSIQWYLTMRLNLICRIFFPGLSFDKCLSFVQLWQILKIDRALLIQRRAQGWAFFEDHSRVELSVELAGLDENANCGTSKIITNLVRIIPDKMVISTY